jgi:hypothetical protein
MVRLIIVRWFPLRAAAAAADTGVVFQDTTRASGVSSLNPTYQTQFEVLFDEEKWLDQ